MRTSSAVELGLSCTWPIQWHWWWHYLAQDVPQAMEPYRWGWGDSTILRLSGGRRGANQSCPNAHFPEEPLIRMLISPPLSCGLAGILAGPWCCPSHGTSHVGQTPSIDIQPLPFSLPNPQHRCLWGNFFLEVACFPQSSSTKVSWLQLARFHLDPELQLSPWGRHQRSWTPK